MKTEIVNELIKKTKGEVNALGGIDFFGNMLNHWADICPLLQFCPRYTSKHPEMQNWESLIFREVREVSKRMVGDHIMVDVLCDINRPIMETLTKKIISFAKESDSPRDKRIYNKTVFGEHILSDLRAASHMAIHNPYVSYYMEPDSYINFGADAGYFVEEFNINVREDTLNRCYTVEITGRILINRECIHLGWLGNIAFQKIGTGVLDASRFSD